MESPYSVPSIRLALHKLSSPGSTIVLHAVGLSRISHDHAFRRLV